MWLCNVVGVPEVRWAAASDQTGHYGLTHIVCEKITFGPDPNPGYGLSSFRAFLRVLRIITEL